MVSSTSEAEATKNEEGLTDHPPRTGSRGAVVMHNYFEMSVYSGIGKRNTIQVINGVDRGNFTSFTHSDRTAYARDETRLRCSRAVLQSLKRSTIREHSLNSGYHGDYESLPSEPRHQTPLKQIFEARPDLP